MIARNFVLGVALTLAASSPALACQSHTGAIFDETFKTPDPGWGPPDQAAAFDADGLHLKPPVNGSAWRWNQNYTADGRDVCIDVQNPRTPTGNADVGVWFWGSNGLNFYTATIALDGTVAVDRLVNGVWHPVLPPRISDAVHTKAGETNEVEVTIQGDTAHFYVNDTKIADFHGLAPPQGGSPGVYGESADKIIDWVFTRVRLF